MFGLFTVPSFAYFFLAVSFPTCIQILSTLTAKNEFFFFFLERTDMLKEYKIGKKGLLDMKWCISCAEEHPSN